MHSNNVKCKNCRHSYSFFKQTSNDKGLPDFVVVAKCRLGNDINSDGTPVCSDCFEPR